MRQTMLALRVGVSAMAALAASPLGEAQAQVLQPPPAFGPSGPYGATPQNGPQYLGPAPMGTQQRLEQSEREDSRRGLEVAWTSVDLGGSYVGLDALGSGSGVPTTHGVGPMVGLGAGVRLIAFTFGARVRLHPLSAFTLWQINAEAGWHVPLGAWDPYVNLHGGYLTSSAHDVPSDFASPHGWDLGVSGGTDYYLSSLFSVGGDATADVLFVKRDAGPAAYPAGSSTGLAASLSLHAGLHFAL
jgi:hypothetical protein